MTRHNLCPKTSKASSMPFPISPPVLSCSGKLSSEKLIAVLSVIAKSRLWGRPTPSIIPDEAPSELLLLHSLRLVLQSGELSGQIWITLSSHSWNASLLPVNEIKGRNNWTYPCFEGHLQLLIQTSNRQQQLKYIFIIALYGVQEQAASRRSHSMILKCIALWSLHEQCLHLKQA